MNNNENEINSREITKKRVKRISSLEDRIIRATEIHNGKYDYSLLPKNFNTRDRISVICPEHGCFVTMWEYHINKRQGCPKCAGKGLSREEKIIRANKIHNNRYDYSLIPEYFKSSDKVKIICSQHGIFIQMWDKHTNLNYNCPKCAGYNVSLKDRIQKARYIHGDKYDYSNLPENFGPFNKVEIICPIHGKFIQSWNAHVNAKAGCPKCKSSKGELIINRFLLNNNIDFIHQKKFDNCVNPKSNRKLLFDFYLPDYNTCIEFDGELHFRAVKHFGGEKELNNIHYRDNIKNQYCIDNNIKMIRISYKEINNVEIILKDLIK
jgi:Zn finger protein HypA/HybF involved in hydrogenase expression